MLKTCDASADMGQL